jgi:hypothetical protein
MKNYLLIILLSITVLAFGQEKIDVVLDWKGIQTSQTSSGTNINYLTFEGSNIDYQYGSLPVFIYSLKIESPVYSYDIEIVNQVFDTLPEESANLISDRDLIENDIVIQYNSNRLRLLPLKYDVSTNKLFLLKSFSIHTTLVPVTVTKETSSAKPDYSDNSVLAQGNWYKMGIVKTGIHKIDRDALIEMGVDPDGIDVNKIGIFGNYTGMLPESNDKERADDLQENAAEYVGLDDGSFDEGDYILFYAQSQEKWRYNPFTARFDHFKNLYADTVFYFFTSDMGSRKQIYIEPGLSVEPTVIVNSFVDYFAHEQDLENMMSSGKEWFGERLSVEEPEISFNYYVPHLKTDKPLFMVFDIIARSFVTSSYKVFVNDGIAVDSTKITKVNPAAEGIFARRSTRSVTFFTDKDSLIIKPVYNSSSGSASAWINFFLLNYERDLIFDGGQMNFRQPMATGLGNKTLFELGNNGVGTEIWDVTDAFQPHKIGFNKSDGQIDFTISTDSLREFISFDNSTFYSPVSFEKVENQNLHSVDLVDLVIVCPPFLQQSAERLAKLHEEHDGMVSLIVSPEQIYNEFSSGSQDVAAIRDFMRMLYLKGVFKSGPGYLLLFGDASFDYKDRIQDNTNIVPTYESHESLRETQSYVTDDFYGLLDDDEGAYCQGVLDIGIGRFPVVNPEQAEAFIDKIESYIYKDQYNLNDWAKRICFIADDGDNNLHFKQADKQLATIVDTLHPGFEINKIYSDAHTKVKIPGGYRFPDVNPKISSQVEDGALIINYTGHGGLIGWSDELILDVPMINNFHNLNNLPVFITATCEFSRFDNPMFTSAGEHTFLNEKGGGIALLTTTRLAYAHANIILNMRIYNNLLKREDGKRPRLGDMIRMAKNPSSTNFLNFTLLGDPALMLDLPDMEIETTSLNNKTVSIDPDTINALSEVSIGGRILNANGETASDYNGYLYPVVYDKPTVYSTLGNVGGSFPADFELEDKILYEGKTSVSNGIFEFSFFVPKDISYNYGFGKISYYAMDTLDDVDAWGGFNNFIIGGTNDLVENDGIGPDISMYVNSRDFSNGDQVKNDIVLLADFYDENGINVTGNSLGRDIVCVVDENTSGSRILNQSYNPDIDTYKKGSLSYDFGYLEPGWHTLGLRAWDLMNNSSTKTIEFLVVDENIALSGVYNYPNPFSENTTFAFNLGGKNLPSKVIIDIFDMRGNFIASLKSDFGEHGAYVNELKWDGTDGKGNKLKHGLYLYKILITDTQGDTHVIQQKMIKLSE